MMRPTSSLLLCMCSLYLCSTTAAHAANSTAARATTAPATVNHSLAASTRPVYAPARNVQRVNNMRAVPTTLRHVPTRAPVSRMAPQAPSASIKNSGNITTTSAAPATHDEVHKAQLLLSVFEQAHQ